jgi:hypothetical protein
MDTCCLGLLHILLTSNVDANAHVSSTARVLRANPSQPLRVQRRSLLLDFQEARSLVGLHVSVIRPIAGSSYSLVLFFHMSESYKSWSIRTQMYVRFEFWHVGCYCGFSTLLRNAKQNFENAIDITVFLRVLCYLNANPMFMLDFGHSIRAISNLRTYLCLLRLKIAFAVGKDGLLRSW